MRCSVTLVRSARSRESLQSTQPQKKENIQMHKCPVLPDWAPAIPVICQPPSPFFATLPQSHMEAGLRWVESTTFLLITSKPGDLLGMAWGLALQPPSVNCSSSLLWPQWWWMASDKVHCLQMSLRAATGACCILLADGTEKTYLFSLCAWETKWSNYFPDITQNDSKKGWTNLTFPEPRTTLQTWNPCISHRGKREGKETEKKD